MDHDRIDDADGAVDVIIVTQKRLVWEAMSRVLRSSGLSVGHIVLPGAAGEAGLGADRAARLILVDIDQGHDGGWIIAARLAWSRPEAGIVAFGVRDPDRQRSRAQQVGLRGYIQRTLSSSDFVHSVGEAMVGRVRARHASLPRSVDARLSGIAAAELTARDRQILALLARGATSRQIARKIGLSHQTVRTYIQQVLRKLNVHSRVEACLAASALGLLSFGSPERWRDGSQPPGRAPRSGLSDPSSFTRS
jgi:DNA-binding NarL/FixJ family response regulator